MKIPEPIFPAEPIKDAVDQLNDYILKTILKEDLTIVEAVYRAKQYARQLRINSELIIKIYNICPIHKRPFTKNGICRLCYQLAYVDIRRDRRKAKRDYKYKQYLKPKQNENSN